MKFTPTPQRLNSQELKEDLAEFIRKIRLLEYFDGEEDTDESLVRNKSDYTPLKNSSPTLEKFMNNLENTPINRRNRNCKENVNQVQRAAIKLLSEDKSIVIKEADTDGLLSFWMLNITKQWHTTYDILSNNENYKLLENDPSKANTISYRKLIEKYTCILTEKEEDYLRRFQSKDCNFYGVPKMHKSTQISSECQQSNIQLNNVSN